MTEYEKLMLRAQLLLAKTIRQQSGNIMYPGEVISALYVESGQLINDLQRALDDTA